MMWMVAAVLYLALVGQLARLVIRSFQRDEEELRRICIELYGCYYGSGYDGTNIR